MVGDYKRKKSLVSRIKDFRAKGRPLFFFTFYGGSGGVARGFRKLFRKSMLFGL